jgi:colicin import membrane protein
MDNNDWKMPFNFALALHIVVLLGAVYMPHLFDNKPLYPDIYTVDLINVTAPLPEAPPLAAKPKAQPKVEPKQQLPTPPAPEKTVSLAEEKPVVEKPAVIDPVSIKPLKQKKVYKNVVDDRATQQRELEKIRQQRILEAQEAERRAQEAAKIAANEAVNQLKEMLRETTAIENSQTVDRSPAVSSQLPKRSKNIVERQYYASVFNALQPHWKLPAYKTWDPDLSATIIIHISKNGEITRKYFESKSGDRTFDQFVLKALQNGAPLPPIPSALNKNELELGLKFTVNSIQ